MTFSWIFKILLGLFFTPFLLSPCFAEVLFKDIDNMGAMVARQNTNERSPRDHLLAAQEKSHINYGSSNLQEKKPQGTITGALNLLLLGKPDTQGWKLIWSDEFNGSTLNTSVWNIEVNDLGGYNNELQYYTDRPENIKVEEGNLIITGRKENYLSRQYTSARINTEGKLSFQYGKMEARIKLPYGNGMWPAFWMMGNNGAWPANGEIDIMEMVGGNACGSDCGDDKTHGYMWWFDEGAQMAGTVSPKLPTGKYNDAYHTFSIEWDEQSIKWFVDDTQFYSHTIVGSAYSEFHQPFYFLLNLAIGGDWPGSPDGSTTWPQTMLVDYVRVYKR